MRNIIASLFVLVSTMSFAFNHLPETDTANALPSSISKIITDSINSFEYRTDLAYDRSWEDYSLSKYPYIFTNDFNGDKLLDYVMLLHSKEGKTILACAFISNNNSYDLFRLKQFEYLDDKTPFVLSFEGNGNWDSAEESMTLNNNGVIIYWITQSKNYMYYWDKNLFKQFLAN